MPTQNKTSFRVLLHDLFWGASPRTKVYWLINACMLAFISLMYHASDIVDAKQIFSYYLFSTIGVFVVYLLTIFIASLGHKKILLIDPVFKVSMIFFIGYSGAPLLLTSNHAFISSMLHDIDVWLGFSTLHSIAWLFQHPWILFVTAYCYINWNWVAIVVITLINIKGDSLYVERILIILQIAVIACALFAYFFPSVSPIVGLQNQVKQLHGYHEFSRFLSVPYQLQEYYNARHHLSVFINGHFFAGFVAFPSFHTFALLLLLRICWQKFKALFVPILCYSILVLIAILGLAHHYIADLAGALLLFCFSIELEKSLFSKIKKTG